MLLHQITASLQRTGVCLICAVCCSVLKPTAVSFVALCGIRLFSLKGVSSLWWHLFLDYFGIFHVSPSLSCLFLPAWMTASGCFPLLSLEPLALQLSWWDVGLRQCLFTVPRWECSTRGGGTWPCVPCQPARVGPAGLSRARVTRAVCSWASPVWHWASQMCLQLAPLLVQQNPLLKVVWVWGYIFQKNNLFIEK